MSYVPAIVWGSSQLAAVLLSRDILGKLLTFSGTLLYRRLSDEAADQPVTDLQAELARVTTLLREAGVLRSDDWEELNGWEIASSQPGGPHRNARLFEDAQPRDMAAWQLKETAEELAGVLESRRGRPGDDGLRGLRGLLATLHSRTEALLAVWHTHDANFHRRRSQSVG